MKYTVDSEFGTWRIDADMYLLLKDNKGGCFRVKVLGKSNGMITNLKVVDKSACDK